MKNNKTNTSKPFGVYIHIPFCSYLCHYCDFAKTARWDQELVDQYFLGIHRQIKQWISLLTCTNENLKFSSVNFGGGTPSLFTSQLEKIIQEFKPYFSESCEVSLEANPNDISMEKLNYWKKSGFNRISVGVQTFQEDGLKFLKREHSVNEATKCIDLSLSVFENVNLDLIYSWPGQSLEKWKSDLLHTVALGPQHLSLYNLTYAPKTPIGRAFFRGKIKKQEDETQHDSYELARDILGQSGFVHEEVSNWTKEGFACKHNWLYWEMNPYLGVGSGAHGFLPFDEKIGSRYSYLSNERQFSKLQTSERKIEKDFDRHTIAGISWEKRDQESWLLEYLGSALRCAKGIDLNFISQISGKSFKASDLVKEQIEKKVLCLDQNRLKLDPSEWFRETYWCLKVSDCFF